MSFGHQFEIAPVEVWLEIANGSRTAPAIVDVEGRETDAIDALAIEIRVALVLQPMQASTNAFATVDGRLMLRLSSGRRCWPFISAVDAMFHPLEVGQHVTIAPTLRAQPLPFVIVAGRAPQEHHSVDGAGAAQHLAAGPDDATAAEVGSGSVA